MAGAPVGAIYSGDGRWPPTADIAGLRRPWSGLARGGSDTPAILPEVPAEDRVQKKHDISPAVGKGRGDMSGWSRAGGPATGARPTARVQ